MKLEIHNTTKWWIKKNNRTNKQTGFFLTKKNWKGWDAWEHVYNKEEWKEINWNIYKIQNIVCPFGWGCKIHRQLLCRGVRPPTNKCPGYGTKKSDSGVLVMLELWRMWGTPCLTSIPGQLWPRVVAPNRAVSTGQIKLNCDLILNWIAWNRTVLAFTCLKKKS